MLALNIIACLALAQQVFAGDSTQNDAVASASGSSPVTMGSGDGSYSGGSGSKANVLEFNNYGFSGYYQQVGKIKNIYKDSCTCELSDKYITFLGANAPTSDEVAVHFRGPLTLNKFAFYTSLGFVHGDNSSSSWTRQSYYDASSGTVQNATFLTKAGKNSTCLGKALTFAGPDGISSAKDATVLQKDNLINSNEEYVIFSDKKCGDSGVGKDCGVYREDNEAYHGFYGDVKMFLFSFKMPTETKIKDTSISNYNMPAIWLLNARIPRTSQYPQNPNCSCWGSGCGEFDIFEVLNKTDPNSLYSTIHDYQGTGDIQTGVRIPGYIKRDLTGTMSGGVAFDSKGKAVIWVSNSTSFDSTISAGDLNGWIESSTSEKEKTLSSASNSPPSGAAHVISSGGLFNKYIMAVSQAFFGFMLYFL